jgi:hypothetical protein
VHGHGTASFREVGQLLPMDFRLKCLHGLNNRGSRGTDSLAGCGHLHTRLNLPSITNANGIIIQPFSKR